MHLQSTPQQWIREGDVEPIGMALDAEDLDTSEPLAAQEDPVTGSAHTTLTPYWSKQLGKDSLSAKQVSSRGGELKCVLEGDRVIIGGEAVTYLKGSITI